MREHRWRAGARGRSLKLIASGFVTRAACNAAHPSRSLSSQPCHVAYPSCSGHSLGLQVTIAPRARASCCKLGSLRSSPAGSMRPLVQTGVLDQSGGPREAAPRCARPKVCGSLMAVVVGAPRSLRRPVVLQTISFRHRLVCMRVANSDDICARWQPNPALNRSAQKRRFWVPAALRASAPG